MTPIYQHTKPEVDHLLISKPAAFDKHTVALAEKGKKLLADTLLDLTIKQPDRSVEKPTEKAAYRSKKKGIT